MQFNKRTNREKKKLNTNLHNAQSYLTDEVADKKVTSKKNKCSRTNTRLGCGCWSEVKSEAHWTIFILEKSLKWSIICACFTTIIQSTLKLSISIQFASEKNCLQMFNFCNNCVFSDFWWLVEWFNKWLVVVFCPQPFSFSTHSMELMKTDLTVNTRRLCLLSSYTKSRLIP